MNLEQLIQQFRVDSDDLVPNPYLWDAEWIAAWLTEAQSAAGAPGSSLPPVPKGFAVVPTIPNPKYADLTGVGISGAVLLWQDLLNQLRCPRKQPVHAVHASLPFLFFMAGFDAAFFAAHAPNLHCTCASAELADTSQ